MAKKKKKKKIYVYTNRELEIKERFVKLYEEFAPEKVRRGKSQSKRHADVALQSSKAHHINNT